MGVKVRWNERCSDLRAMSRGKAVSSIRLKGLSKKNQQERDNMAKKRKNDKEVAQCPFCGKTFYRGGFHPADQKLYHHMLNSHRSRAHERHWDTTYWWYGA